MREYGEMTVTEYKPLGNLNNVDFIAVTEIDTGHVVAITGTLGHNKEKEARELAWLIANAPKLLKQAKLVVATWEIGDLAEAVTELGQLVTKIENGGD